MKLEIYPVEEHRLVGELRDLVLLKLNRSEAFSIIKHLILQLSVYDPNVGEKQKIVLDIMGRETKPDACFQIGVFEDKIDFLERCATFAMEYPSENLEDADGRRLQELGRTVSVRAGKAKRERK